MRDLAQPAMWMLALAFEMALVGPAVAASGTRIDLSGTLTYPDTVPGNSSGTGSEYHSGPVAGNGQAKGLQLSAQGVDNNSITGTASFQAAANAELGTLHAVAGGTASSAPQLFAPSPHADARSSATASFWDTVMLYDPAQPLFAPISVVIQIQLDWVGAYGGAAFNTYNDVEASSSFGITALGNVGASRSRNSGSGVLHSQDDPPLTVTAINGQLYDIAGSLFVTEDSSVGGVTNDTVNAYATSDASNTAHFFISGAPTLTVIGEGGHNYLPSAVPEPSKAWLLVVGATALGLWRRRSAKPHADHLNGQSR